MIPSDRLTFLYKLEAACEDFVAPRMSGPGSAILREHLEYIEGLHKRGDIVLFGVTLTPDPKPLGLCVFYAPSETAAQSIMENDPLIAKGAARGTLHPFHVSLRERNSE